MRKIYGKLTKELVVHTTPKTVGNDNGFKVATFRDLVEQIAKLSFLNKDYLVFFRGQKSDYKKLRTDRYASYDAGKGKEFEEGKLTLEDLRNYAVESGEPATISGKQEYFENIINKYI